MFKPYQKLHYEMDGRVVPRASDLVESLRVANLLTNEEMPGEITNELDKLHLDAMDLADRLAALKGTIYRTGSEEETIIP